MPRFKIAVRSDNPAETLKALEGAGLRSSASYTRAGDRTKYGQPMTVRLEAPSADAATEKVRKAVGGGCELKLVTDD